LFNKALHGEILIEPLNQNPLKDPTRIENTLQDQTEIAVRFNEADPLGVVWHGHYLRYFEDGRESFGKKYGVTYLDFYNQGFAVPVISIHCDFKKPLRYGASVFVKTNYISSPAAKLIFEYKIFETKSNDLVAVGNSVQVFVDYKTFDLHMTVPLFFQQWKEKWNLK
jgi:acyl-CoA thioester hydrolase